MQRFKSVLDVTVSVAILALVLMIAWTRFAPPRKPVPTPQAINLRFDPARAYATRGAGRTVLVEFTDDQCPYCARFAADELPTLTKDLIATNKITFLQVDFPVHGDRVKAEAIGKEFQLRGTPSFLLGTLAEDGTVRLTQKYNGVVPAGVLESALTALQ